MKPSLLSVIGLFLSGTGLLAASEFWPTAATLPEASFPKVATREITVADGLTITAKFELTEKGNGGLSFPGGGLRVYDAFRDGVTFKDYLLKCEWKDMNGDGLRDLVVSGVARFWSADHRHVEVEKPVSAVYHFDRQTKRLVKLKCSPEIFSW